MTTTRVPDGTYICYHGDIQAIIEGYNGIDHRIVARDDGGPNIWSSNFTVGFCIDDEPKYEPDDEPTDKEPIYGDIPPGDDEYPPKSQVATDLSAIFGDIKPIYIIAAIIALILLG